MGGTKGRGGGGGHKAPQNQTHKKKNKKSADSQKETNSNSESSDSDNSKKSTEDLSKESDLEITRQQARRDFVIDEIFPENRNHEVGENHNLNLNLNHNLVNSGKGFFAAPGDERRNQAKMITKRSQSAKRRRHSMAEDSPISEQIFENQTIEEQTIIVVNNLSTDIEELRSAYLKDSKEIRNEIKTDQTKKETTAANMANKIEALKATINEMKAEAEDGKKSVHGLVTVIQTLSTTAVNMANKIEALRATTSETKAEADEGKKSVHDLVTAVQTLSTMVEEQNTTIKGLVTGKVDLKDSTDLQNKITEVMKGHLKSLSDTVVKYSDRNLGVTQSRAHEIKTAANQIQNELEKSLKTSDFLEAKMPKEQTIETVIINDEISNMGVSSSNYTPNARGSSSGANSDGTHNGQKLTVGGQRPGLPPPPKTYANTAKTGLEGGLPVGAPPPGQKYNHKLNNKATFDRMEAEGPTMVRRDYATFPDGNIQWNVHYEPKKPELTEVQKKRRKTKWEKDREKTDKEVLIFMIPTRDAAGRINSREYDNAQVIRLLKELARGGFFLKPDDIVGTVRQIQNDRHPQHLPITVTCKDKETAENIITAASNIYLNGGRRAKADDEEKGRFGYFRPSLSEAERKAIKEKHRLKETPHGKGQAEIRQRKYDSQTGAEEWSELIREEYNGEEVEIRFGTPNPYAGVLQTLHENMVVEETEAPENTTPARMPEIVTEDENLNRVTPPATAAPAQSTQDKENETIKLKKQLEEMSKQLEELTKNKT